MFLLLFTMRFGLFLLSLFIVLKSYGNQLTVISVVEPPSNYINADNLPDGYVTDIMQALMTEAGQVKVIEFVPEARAMHMMAKQPNIMLFSISRTKHREDKFHWIGHVMSKAWHVYARSDSDLNITSIDDLKKLSSLGVVRGDVREEWLSNQGFANLRSITEHEQNIRLLMKGRVDAIAYEEQGLLFALNKTNFDREMFKSIYQLNESDVYISMSKNGTNEATVKRWQAAFNRIKTNGILENIAKKWQKRMKAEFAIDTQLKEGKLSL